MNFIDIASWQKGIDLATVFKENPLDGVIVKATEGTNYVNPHFTGWAMWLKDNGKPLGLYHFLAGGSAESEAAFFVQTIRLYIERHRLSEELPRHRSGTDRGQASRLLQSFRGSEPRLQRHRLCRI